ncbi:hypothetical protein [Haloferax profundi]|uniref:Uncharacterized protein n=1 Tax=Haloferax profundi TaxID=1544718 RepID=A0A0W1SGG8_9EURY|nr:hypothetical protein [Haloferax profundi]KTG25225.1 hypothetical protein AUR66_16355 [Haloferax profundi]
MNESNASGLVPEVLHEHDEHGEILLIDIHLIFDEYDLEAGNGELHPRIVRYTPDWDGYGPMPGSIRVTSIDEFQDQLGDPVRPFEAIEPHAEMNDE